MAGRFASGTSSKSGPLSRSRTSSTTSASQRSDMHGKSPPSHVVTMASKSSSSSHSLNAAASSSSSHKLRKNHVVPVVKVERMTDSSVSTAMSKKDSKDEEKQSPLSTNSSRNQSNSKNSSHKNRKSLSRSSSPALSEIKTNDPPKVTTPNERQEKGPPKLLGGTTVEVTGDSEIKEVILNIPSPKDNEGIDAEAEFAARIIISPSSSPTQMQLESIATNVTTPTTATTTTTPATSMSQLHHHMVVTTIHSSTLSLGNSNVAMSSKHPGQVAVGVAAITKPQQSAASSNGLAKMGPPLIATATAAKQAPMMAPKVPATAKSNMATTNSSTTPTTATSSSSKSSSKSSKKNKVNKVKPEKFIPCALREYDPDRHCGVWNSELNQHCTRSLTCKAHALSLRRAVTGRSKSFDQLLKDHKEAKEALLRAQGKLPPAPASTASSTVSIPSTPATSTPALHKQKPAPTAGISYGTPQVSKGIAGSPLTSPTLSVSGLLMKSPLSFSHPLPQRDSDRERTSTPLTALSVSKLGRAASAKLVPSTLLPRPQTLPVFPKPEQPLIPMELGDASWSSSGEEDEDEDGEEGERGSSDYPYISHHPRPAAVNSFGAWRHGKGCYVFNRKEDLYRAAFMATVERHLHPPPHKKLCVESKLPKGSTVSNSTTDPYDFLTSNNSSGSGSGDGSHSHHKSRGHSHHNKPSVNSTGSYSVHPQTPTSPTKTHSSLPASSSSLTSQKPKSKGNSSTSNTSLSSSSSSSSSSGHSLSSSSTSSQRPVKPKDGKQSSKVPQATGSSTGSSRSTGSNSSSSLSSSYKRKRSGSSTGSSVASSTPNPSPISLAIPTAGLNLNLGSHTLGNLSAANIMASAHKGNTVNHSSATAHHVQIGGAGSKNNLLKDLSIVVTGIDASMMNGQIVSLAGSSLSDMATHIQLNNLTAMAASSADSKSGTKFKAKSPITTGKAVSVGGGVMGTLPANAIVMENAPSRGTMLAQGPLAMVSGTLTSIANGSNCVITTSQPNPSPLQGSHVNSNCGSPLSGVPSPVPNGMVPSPNSKPCTAANHVTIAKVTDIGGRVNVCSSPTLELADKLRSPPMSIGGTSYSVTSGKVDKTGSGQRSHQVHTTLPLTASTAQQLAAAALNLTPSLNQDQFLTANSFRQIYPGAVLNTTSAASYASLQFQSKGSSKANTGVVSAGGGAKVAMQPVSLTIVAPSNVSGVGGATPQQARLVLQGDSDGRHKSRDLAPQVQNSPSNVFS